MSSSRRTLDAGRVRGLLRRPSVATPRLIGRTLAFDFAFVGILTLVATLWPAVSGERHTAALRAVAVAAVLVSPLMLRLRRNDWWILNGLSLAGTACVSLGVWLTGGGVTAVASSPLFLLVIVHVFYSHARPIASLHAVLAVGCWLYLLRNDHTIGNSERVALLGVALAVAVLTAGMVRQADLAEHDFSTGLLNRRGLEKRATSLLAERSPDDHFVLAMIDVDDFRRTVADLDPGRGEDLLLDLARQWKPLLPAGALLARTGGDEFLLVFSAEPVDAEAVMASMLAVSAPTTFCAGLAWAGEGESLSGLLSRADAAVYEAKSHGTAQLHLAGEPVAGDDGLDIVAALADGQFALYYQPIVDLGTGIVVKAEALIRWHHPERGLVPPDEFIRRAEETDAIYPLGDWIINTACTAAVGWDTNRLGEPVAVTVNASGRELADPSYADRVADALRSSGLSPQQLIIELVETDYNTASDVITDNLTQLTLMGIKLAIDDFGTGYSSLNRLQALQVDIIKIDRSFISEIQRSDQTVPLITAIMAMAEAMTLEVVAEGIETEQQAAWLRSRGCRHAQGYLFGKPAPGDPTGCVVTIPTAQVSAHV